MLAKGGERIAEVDRNLGCGWTSRLEIAVPDDRDGRVAEKDQVHRVELVRDRVSWPAPHDEEEHCTDCGEHAASRRGTSAGNARARHRTALVDEPVGDEKGNGDGEEDLVPVLRAHSALGRRGSAVDRAQAVGEALRRSFGVVAEVLPTAV